jgi:hypothetical protein
LPTIGAVSERKYYGLIYRHRGQFGWLLWFSNDHDGLDVVDGSFPVFASAESLAASARSRGIEIVVEEGSVYDLDAITGWLARPRGESVDPKGFLDGWNLFGDVASSLQQSLKDDTPPHQELYDKLFHWGGPDWVTGRDPIDSPEWAPEEVALLAGVLDRGLEMLVARLTSSA